MKILSDLKKFITAHRGGPLDDSRSATRNFGGDRLLSAFYEALWEQPSIDEDHLAASLYGEDADRKTNAYKKLKQRALENLTGQILLIGSNSPVFTPDQRGYYRAYREYVVAELLRARSFKESAAYFHRRALSKARKYGIVSLQVLALDALAYYAGVHQRSLRTFEAYQSEYQQALAQLMAERDVATKFVKVKLLRGASPSSRQKKHEEAMSFIEELDERYLVADYGHQYAFAYYLIKLEGWMAISSHDMTLEVADEAIEFYTTLQPARPVALSYFLMHKLIVHAIQKDFERGVEIYKKCHQIVDKGLSNWYKLPELAIFFFLQTEHFNRAATIYSEFCSDTPLAAIPVHLQEKWHVYRAYFHYLKRCGGYIADDWKDPEGSFRINRFLNSVPLMSGEKRGSNISVLVIQFLFILQRRNFVEAVDRIEALEKYITRYLSKKENYRSYCFLRLLLLFPKCDFKHKEIAARSKTWLMKLNGNSIEVVNQSFELELIPYENLFSIALLSVR